MKQPFRFTAAPILLGLLINGPLNAQGRTGISAGIGLAGTFLRERQYVENLHRQLHFQVHRRITPKVAVALEYLAARNIAPNGCDVSDICAPPVEFKAGIATVAWSPSGNPLLGAGIGLYRLGANLDGKRSLSPGLHTDLEFPLLRFARAVGFVGRLRGSFLPFAPGAPIGMVTGTVGFRAWLR
jgi:hypothetical protein